MKTNNYTTTNTIELSNSSKNLIEAFDKQLMNLLKTELAQIKAAKAADKQLAA
jgi:hypothetical protein